ncbi:MAG: EF-P lysine aminoacylase EpmA [Gammaproteobacteria bacterium]
MDWRPSASLEIIRTRTRIYQKIRTFFEARDFLEVDTPLLSAATNTDPNIESIAVSSHGQALYLQTSPEFAMKRLLAAGSGSIYQICHAFRAGEQGRLHRAEFTLLEWYRTGYDYQRLMDEVEQLIDCLSDRKNNFQRIRYRDLLLQKAGIDIASIELPELHARCDELLPGADASSLGFDQCLDLLIALVIAPAMRGYLFVYDYPLSQASLARASERDPNIVERFELFHDGLELANGFSELTDAKLQRERFEADNQKREASALPLYPIDQQLLAALESGLPECAGIALGLDRLLMVLLGLDSIDQVMSFSH